MKHLKKYLVVLLVLFAMLTTACGSPKTETTKAPTATDSETIAPTAEPTAEESEPAPEETAVTEADSKADDKTVSVDDEIVLTDMTGREIRMAEPATRVVALTASDCEILYAIGAGDTLVGRGTYCDYPEAVLDVPVVESGRDMNAEQIIALDPQVLLMSTMAQTEEQAKALEDAGITVVVSDADDIEGVYTSIQMIGDLMGKKAEAEDVISAMKATFDNVTKEKFDGTKTVYFEVSPLEYGLYTAGKGTFMQEAADLVGLKNIFDDVDGWAAVSEEQVLERNPDYIVTITMYFGEGPTPVEELLSRKGWESVTAIQNEAILSLQDNELSRPAPRLAEGVELLHEFVTEYESK